MDKKLYNLRHSTSHLLAAAVKNLFPDAKPTLGPPIENGFYYDFDNLNISESDFPKIEKEMQKLVKSWNNFEIINDTVENIKKIFKDNKYKLDLIKEHEDKGEEITIYKSGDFVDLCKGGHVDNPNREIKYFKLLKTSGAYWRGNEKNKMLTRIYGVVFFKKEDLYDYIKLLNEAKLRDHRKLGKTLDLFTFSDLVGAGLPLYTPKGALIRNLVNEYIEETQSAHGYQQVWTNQFAKAELYKISGHYDKYKDSMFRVVSNYTDEEFFLKPMNCPQHTQIYASNARSYKDLPIRYTDFAMLYRDEKPGELNGLARVRSFSQDDCHIFCKEDQVNSEIDSALKMIKDVMKTFGFKYRYRLSTRDLNNQEKYLGDPKVWDRVEKWAIEIMKRNNIEYTDGPGEAAFYAPKMDLLATDALGREWQLSTIQIDYVMPERFKLEYTDKDGNKKTPVMIHRAIVGSPERFLMILIENFAGNFPTWLNPSQVKILPITERNIPYAYHVYEKLLNNKIRINFDDRNETLGAKIRDAQNDKVSYMLIIGDKEENNKLINVRRRGSKDTQNMKLDKFIDEINKKIKYKVLD